MPIVFLGADFQDAPLSLLEAFETHVGDVRRRLADAPNLVKGSVVVSTCNRAELYVHSDFFQETLDFLIELVAEVLAERPEVIGKIFRVHYGSSLTRHLFAVTAGLESMVVGEGEIAAQMRKALQSSRDDNQLTSELDVLFQRAFSVAKTVWKGTDLGNSGRSIIYTAMTLASATMGEMAGKTALVVGTGAYARVVTAALKRAGLSRIGVFSRTGRAENFAKSHGIEPVTADSLRGFLAQAELVVSASGQHGYAITAMEVSLALAAGEARDRVFIDVALSRDVDPEVARLPQCTIITLDLLRLHNPPEHQESLLRAEALVDRETADFQQTLSEKSVEPAISALRAHIETRIAHEVDAVRKRAGDEVAQEVERALRRVTNSLVHTPMTKGKELARDGRPDDYRQALELLFGLDMSRHA
jgi:glutamyl-tRNA reductase